MIFHNASSTPVVIQIENRTHELLVDQYVDVPTETIASVVLHHTYGSSSKTEQEIARNLSNPSVFSEGLAAIQDPYFYVVLDSRFLIETEPDAIIHIQRQRLYPTPGIVYDRLFPKAEGIIVQHVQHTFDEKEEFTKRYKNARFRSSWAERISRVVLIVLVTIFAPLLAQIAYWTGIVGFLLGFVFAGLFCGGCAMIMLAAFATRKMEEKFFVRHFSEEVIMEKYEEAQRKNSMELD